MILYRPLWEALVEILVPSSLNDLARIPLSRSCGDPGEILYRSLSEDVEEFRAKSSKCPAAAGPLSHSSRSLRDPVMKVWLLCADLAEILVTCYPRPLHDLVQVLVRR